MDEAVLEPKSVGDITGSFWVPSYQRGYRWGAPEVDRLLSDIWASEGKSYYLQPVVVTRREDLDAWELIDGQQRLTTLYLIFQYMKDQGYKRSGAGYEIGYQTRPESPAFLKDPKPELASKNIDFHHIYQAYKSIHAWFEQHGSRAEHAAGRIYDYLLDPDPARGVKVIWYEAPPTADPVDIFTRLNVGRIPLTDAELVKAFLLSRSRGAPGRADRSEQVAAQWDAFELALREPEVWAFVTKKHESEATHIELLLDTLADRKDKPVGGERPSYHTFETLRPFIQGDPQVFWDEVVKLHSLILGWYDDRDFYHKVGYLVAVGHRFGDLVEMAQGKTKTRLHQAFDDLIRARIKSSAADIAEMNFLDDYQQAFDALLLMNVETVRSRKETSERYSFRAHSRGDWSLEHIHAQNAGEMKRDEKLWDEWLVRQRKELFEVRELQTDIREELITEIDSIREAIRDDQRRGGVAPRFNAIRTRVEAALSDPATSADVNVHGISNLALLGSGDNSALSNSMFAAKRREILERDRRGSYVPACTRNVFLKYYTKSEDQQFYFWSGSDREDYVSEIVRVLTPYLTPEVATA